MHPRPCRSLLMSLMTSWRSMPYHRSCCSTSGSLPLRLTNTFTKIQEDVMIKGKTVTVSSTTGSVDRHTGTVYCCGPTVYDDSHIGHAYCYTRFDLLRRALQTYCNTDLVTCMGVTDIDDKILDRGKKGNEEWTSISKRYFESFQQDMRDLNCLPVHAFLQVSHHVPHIMQYVQDLENSGSAYVNEETLDVVFNSASIKSSSSSSSSSSPSPSSESESKSSDPYETGIHDADKMRGKRSPADFVLWKKRKPGEPFFEYESVTKQSLIEGRPGWHVECSAMIHAAFGDQIDFHFGGADLVFPHHYNESACCAAHNSSRQQRDRVTDWCNYWIHSGTLITYKEKMSKSLGNVISIKDFLKIHSHNIMRIICLRSGPRSDIHFDREALNIAAVADVKLKRLAFLLDDGIRVASSGGPQVADPSLDQMIPETEAEILSGIANDLDFNTGLNAVINLYNVLKDKQDVQLVTLIKMKIMWSRWLAATGLVYGSGGSESSSVSPMKTVETLQLLDYLKSVRQEIRRIGIELVKSEDMRGKQLLKLTDEIRSKLDQYGVMSKDPPS